MERTMEYVKERGAFLGARFLRQLPVTVIAGLSGYGVQAAGLKIAVAKGAQGKDALPLIQLAGHMAEAFLKEVLGETVEFAVGPRLAVPAGDRSSRWFPYSLQSGITRLFGSSLSEAGSTIGDAMVRAYAYGRMRARFGNEVPGSGDPSDVTMRILANLKNLELLAIKGVSSGAWLAHKVWDGAVIAAMPGARRDNPPLREIASNLAVREGIGVGVRALVGLGTSQWLKHLADRGETGYLLGRNSASVPAALQAAQPLVIDMLYYLYLVHIEPRHRTRGGDSETAPESHPLQLLAGQEAGRRVEGGVPEHDGAGHDPTLPPLPPSAPESVAETSSGPSGTNAMSAPTMGNEPEHQWPTASASTTPGADDASIESNAAAASAGSPMAGNMAGTSRPGSAGKQPGVSAGDNAGGK